MIKQNFCTVNFQDIPHKKDIFSKELTLLLVLEGTITIEDEGQIVHLCTGELYCLNLNHLATMTPYQSDYASVVFLQINPIFFTSQFPDFLNVKFALPIHETSFDKQQAVNHLTNLLVDLLINEFSYQETRTVKQLILLESIILSLTEHFKYQSTAISVHSSNFQTKEIIHFINQHYHEGLTVKEIAEEFFLSEASLSKMFKKETGLYLSKYLKKLQVTRSANELLYSDATIEKIALNAGFNSAKIYREQFKHFFNMSPTEYREQHQMTDNNQPIALTTSHQQPKEIIEQLYQLIKREPHTRQPEQLHKLTKHLEINDSQSLRTKHANDVIVHIEYLSDLNKAHIQKELLELLNQQTLTIISCFNFFPELPVSYRLSKNANLNSFPAFEELDTGLAFLMNHQLKLMIQFDLMDFDDQTISLYLELFNYMINRWGRQFLSTLSFNVQSFTLDNVALYQEFYQSIHHYYPEISFGIKLPISDPFDNQQTHTNIKQLLTHVNRTYNFLSYTADSNYIFNQTNNLSNKIVEAHHYLTNKSNWIKHCLNELSIDCPLYLTEWNTLTGTTINYNGLFFRGALITKQLLNLEQLIDGYGFWLNLESHEHYNLRAQSPSIGLDLFHYHQNRRPAFFSLQLANRMQGTVIREDDFYLLTQHGEKLQLMMWNENYFDPHLSTELAFMNSQILSLSLSIHHLLEGKYQVKQIDFNRESGALFYSYMDFKQTAHLDKETIDYIHAKNRPNLQVFDVDISERFDYSFSLDTNAVILLEFTPIAT
ncbi:helix-turn-helix domain-containing protein [Vagococcus xieshaowenii]|uniref:Helix-turn-helix domain-containing protein n=1 Tax=Vagococcus xieshaowenii TaxID=2562451 RepID=A0AAJ5JKZ5_9ENTE|nr:helix-turn-helix domain-containing protein [Vagococcus xieshaowenii]QCA29188.1 helix-turn-helix domain-containing protein [Vagococcus xieshaowenii]TFZ40834.1 helix-turn-helix domain-containing protein [Vagococcus xieshaowenii]